MNKACVTLMNNETATMDEYHQSLFKKKLSKLVYCYLYKMYLKLIIVRVIFLLQFIATYKLANRIENKIYYGYD